MIRTIFGTLAVVTAFAAPLEQGERDRAMSHLHATRKAFLDSVAGLSDAQWNFKPAPERWSIAECAEHIAVSEDSLFDLLRQILKSPAAPEKKAASHGKDQRTQLPASRSTFAPSRSAHAASVYLRIPLPLTNCQVLAYDRS